jgi:hypothetical protein
MLYPEIFWNLSVLTGYFGGGFLSLSIKLCHLQTGIALPLSFLLGYYLFLLLIALDETSNTMMVNQSGHPCLFPNVRGNNYLYPFSAVLDVGLSYVAFIVLR